MTLTQFWTILVRQWKIILLCFLVVGTGTFIKSKLTTPLYQSSVLVQVSVGTGSTDLNDLLASNQLVQTEVILATTSPILKSVASDYNGLTLAQLSAEVSVAAKTNSQLFEISVLDPNPTRAASIANDVAETLIKEQTQQQLRAVPFNKEKPSQYLLLVQPAQVNLKPVQPNTTLNTELGLLAGLFLGMLLAIIMNQFDTRTHTIATPVTPVSEKLTPVVSEAPREEQLSSK